MRQALYRLGARGAISALLLGAMILGSGCAVPGAVAHGLTHGRKTDVPAQYTGLENQSVAVLVAADEYMLYEHPRCRQTLTELISGQIAGGVEGASVMQPGQVAQYTRSNPYWNTQRYSRVLADLEVDRLVVVDLRTYRTQEPGNREVTRGVVAGDVRVFEGDSDDPDNAAFSRDVRIQFPEDIRYPVGEDRATIERGMATLFSRDASRLFYDHEVEN